MASTSLPRRLHSFHDPVDSAVRWGGRRVIVVQRVTAVQEYNLNKHHWQRPPYIAVSLLVQVQTVMCFESTVILQNLILVFVENTVNLPLLYVYCLRYKAVSLQLVIEYSSISLTKKYLLKHFKRAIMYCITEYDIRLIPKHKLLHAREDKTGSF